MTETHAATMITVELLYLAPERQWKKQVQVAEGATVADVLGSVPWQDECPELQGLPYGIFGELVSGTYVLHDGDRLEFYRELSFDPTDSRRRRAEHKARSLAEKQGKKSLSAAASMLLHSSKKN
ncbi:RnfH family protein [Paenalcaligenes sp. Me131]|uniref:RnfH family protein n=1 Tax=Paenalcaligenes sp. Me131 TaxID=3392636 RepID=UPI003D2DE063